MTTLEIMQQAKACRMQLAQATGQQKNDMLLSMADALVASQDAILAANAQDLAAAKGQISDVMLDRLALDASRIAAMPTGCGSTGSASLWASWRSSTRAAPMSRRTRRRWR